MLGIRMFSFYIYLTDLMQLIIFLQQPNQHLDQGDVREQRIE